MNEDIILGISGRAMKITAMLGGPMLLGALVIGMAISIFQSVTQINEQTLAFIPKVLVIGFSLIIFGPWMIELITNFTRELVIDIPNIVVGK